MVIEIENSNGGKYLMGDILNAAILGHVGVVVVNESLSKHLTHIKGYLDGAHTFGKIRARILENVCLFTYEEFKRKLDEVPSN